MKATKESSKDENNSSVRTNPQSWGFVLTDELLKAAEPSAFVFNYKLAIFVIN
ncbi:hypothetical protein RintRC_7153 [Richelia intracellularis]|nr:hypothetical protein RintRC_7153 [Richelia intracellularis]